MKNLLAAAAAVVSILLPCADSLAQATVPGDIPTATLVAEDFSPMQEQWQPASGSWTTSGGTYGVAAAPQAISTITSYRGTSPDQTPSMELQQQDFIVRARVRNSGTTDSQLVGLVYGYQDSQNYYEVVLSAIGNLTMRRIQNGVAVVEVPGFTLHIPRNTWTDLEVRWNHGVAALRINGGSGFIGVQQPEFTTGQVGLISYGATARFDKVFIGVPNADQPFLELFDDHEPDQVTFEPKSGQWAVTGNIYSNSAVQATNVSLAPVHNIGTNPGQTSEYTFRTDMLNPYAGAGNLVGIVFNYTGSSYHEVVFSPTGVAKVNRFENGRLTTLATASYNGHRGVPFNVQLEFAPNRNAVLVDGVRIFSNFDNPQQIVAGGVGLITHWAPGRFDNIQFDQGIFQPCSFTFGNPPQSKWIVSGTWDTAGGTLNNTSAGSSDIVDLQCIGNDIGTDSGTDYILRARLLNQFAGAGNLLGLVFDYQGANSFYAGEYFEVVFSPTGIVQLNKFIEGVRSPIATATYNVPRNTFFDVEVRREASDTSVLVNGTALIRLAATPDLRDGSVGVISHFAKGKADNMALVNNPPRPPSEL